jgi:hypothetical protein
MADATATKTTAGFKVPCPLCGHATGLAVRAHDLTLTCTECSEDVERSAVERMVADALRLLKWLDAASA